MNGILPKPGDILKRSQIKQPILLFWHFSRLASIIRCMRVHCRLASRLGKITVFDRSEWEKVPFSWELSHQHVSCHPWVCRRLEDRGLQWLLWGNLWLNQSWACHGYLDVSGKRGLSPCRCHLSCMSVCQIKYGCLPHDTITPHRIDGTLSFISWRMEQC